MTQREWRCWHALDAGGLTRLRGLETDPVPAALITAGAMSKGRPAGAAIFGRGKPLMSRR